MRELIARTGVVVCVAMAAYVGASRLDDTIAVFDDLADRNAEATYFVRTYSDSSWVAGSPRVIDDARLWMPRDATYRVVRGPKFDYARSSGYGGYFLLGLMLPRKQTESLSARWVFCYGCTASTLGPRFEVLSASSDGFLFGRVSS